MSIFEYNEEEEREKLRKAEYENGRQDGFAEGVHMGISRGIAKGKAESILSLLEEYAAVPTKLQESILQEKDQGTLTTWLKLAAKSDSLEEFIRQTGLADMKK